MQTVVVCLCAKIIMEIKQSPFKSFNLLLFILKILTVVSTVEFKIIVKVIYQSKLGVYNESHRSKFILKLIQKFYRPPSYIMIYVNHAWKLCGLP